MGGEVERIAAADAVSALSWWLEAGVDSAVQEAPRNWLAPRASAAAPQAIASAPQAPSAAASEPMPATLDLFRDWLATAPSLPLSGEGARRVLPHGAEAAPVMLISEMPAGEDAADGRPIGGQAWKLVERMLAAIGIDAADAYSASLACFHAPGTKLSGDTLSSCAEIARRHISVAKPQRLLLFGDAPSLALLGKPVAAARGHVHKVEGVRTIVTFHPRFLMNQPSNKRLAWDDLLLLVEDEV
jgi:DNA polymerase